MKAPAFGYLRPTSVDEAIAALARHGDDAAILAGGQSLVPMLNLRVTQPAVLVDINRIPGLDRIREHDDHLAIGALVRYAQLQASPLVREHLPLVAAALPHVAHEAIRNRGTLGGSLALADPAAELPTCCLAQGATVALAGPGGRREIAIEDWFTGLYDTAREDSEIVVEVRIRKSAPGVAVRFEELTRRHGDFAVVGVAVATGRDGGALASPRIAVLGAADRPVLARTLMQALDGTAPGRTPPEEIAAALDADIEPSEDPAWPAAYRRHALAVLVRRVLASLESRP